MFNLNASLVMCFRRIGYYDVHQSQVTPRVTPTTCTVMLLTHDGRKCWFRRDSRTTAWYLHTWAD